MAHSTKEWSPRWQGCTGGQLHSSHLTFLRSVLPTKAVQCCEQPGRPPSIGPLSASHVLLLVPGGSWCSSGTVGLTPFITPITTCGPGRSAAGTHGRKAQWVAAARLAFPGAPPSAASSCRNCRTERWGLMLHTQTHTAQLQGPGGQGSGDPYPQSPDQWPWWVSHCQDHWASLVRVADDCDRGCYCQWLLPPTCSLRWSSKGTLKVSSSYMMMPNE